MRGLNPAKFPIKINEVFAIPFYSFIFSLVLMPISRRDFLSLLGYGGMAGTVSCLPAILKTPKCYSYNKALLIGIDGLRSDALLKASTPTIDALIAGGAYSLDAQAGMHTISGPGWSNILTGVWENKHGVVDNTFKGADYIRHPSIFTKLEQLNPRLSTKSIVSWDGIQNNIITQADKRLYFPYFENGDVEVARNSISTLQNENPDLMFTYFSNVDVAGHRYGFGPEVPEYIREIQTIDYHIGNIMYALISRSSSIVENWLVLIVSDHGGTGKGHGGQSPEEKTIPFIMWGNTVNKRKIVPFPLQVDVMPTILNHLKVEVSDSWDLDGSAVEL